MALKEGPSRTHWRRISSRTLFLSAVLWGPPAPSAPPPDRESWRKVEAGRITVVGTASDTRLVETAVTFRALVALLPGFVPGALDALPPIVLAVVHDQGDLARVGLPAGGPAAGRIVLAATSDEEARAGLLRSTAGALARRSSAPLPAWLVTGLAEYLSTFSATQARATLGRLVPDHVELLRAARLPEGRPALFSETVLDGTDGTSALLQAEAWAAVHVLLQETPDGEERLGRFAALLRSGLSSPSAFGEAFGESERSLLVRARRHVIDSRPLARIVEVPAAAPPVGRLLPLTRAGAAGVLGGVARGRRAPVPGSPAPAGAPGAATPQPPVLSSSAPRQPASVPSDVPAEVDLVNRLIDEGREEEALARLEALYASLGKDPEMQRALGWDVQEVRRVVVHNRLVRRYNEAIGLLNAGRREEAIAIFREVATAAEDPGLRRLAWERATAPEGRNR